MERGVWQRSMLSPVLFLVVMDPLSHQLEESGIGLSVNSFYAGGFLHADDIRTFACICMTAFCRPGSKSAFHCMHGLVCVFNILSGERGITTCSCLGVGSTGHSFFQYLYSVMIRYCFTRFHMHVGGAQYYWQEFNLVIFYDSAQQPN